MLHFSSQHVLLRFLYFLVFRLPAILASKFSEFVVAESSNLGALAFAFYHASHCFTMRSVCVLARSNKSVKFGTLVKFRIYSNGTHARNMPIHPPLFAVVTLTSSSKGTVPYSF